jgi:hypothetical protein
LYTSAPSGRAGPAEPNVVRDALKDADTLLRKHAHVNTIGATAPQSDGIDLPAIETPHDGFRRHRQGRRLHAEGGRRLGHALGPLSGTWRDEGFPAYHRVGHLSARQFSFPK